MAANKLSFSISRLLDEKSSTDLSSSKIPATVENVAQQLSPNNFNAHIFPQENTNSLPINPYYETLMRQAMSNLKYLIPPPSTVAPLVPFFPPAPNLNLNQFSANFTLNRLPNFGLPPQVSTLHQRGPFLRGPSVLGVNLPLPPQIPSVNFSHRATINRFLSDSRQPRCIGQKFSTSVYSKPSRKATMPVKCEKTTTATKAVDLRRRPPVMNRFKQQPTKMEPKTSDFETKLILKPKPTPKATMISPNSSLDPADSATKTFPCPVCGKMFYAHYNLTRHMPVHTGVRNFVCKVNAFLFKNIS